MFAATAGFAQSTGAATSFESLQSSLKLKNGQRIEITDVNGKKISAKIESLSRSLLTARAGKSTFTFKETEVAQIRYHKPDPLLNGILIGAGIGAVSGVAVGISSCRNDSECAAIVTTILTPIFAGGGAGIGAVVDSLHHKNELIYSRNTGSALQRLNVAPIAGKNKAGVRLSFSF